MFCLINTIRHIMKNIDIAFTFIRYHIPKTFNIGNCILEVYLDCMSSSYHRFIIKEIRFQPSSTTNRISYKDYFLF